MTTCNQEYIVVGGYAYPKNCVPTKVTQSSKIQYNGVDLPNTGINTCDTLNVALQKIDAAIDSACDIIEVTYEQLVLLINSSSLSPGSFYKITDFATIHYLTSEGVILESSPVIGVTEPLIVFATSETTIDKEAKSTLYPQDVIYYDWSPTNWLEDISFGGTTAEIISGFKGVIYFRHDTLLDNYMGYDFRNVKFRRYKTEYPSWDSGTTYALDAKVQDATGAYCSMESGNLNNPLSTAGKWFKFIDFTITSYLSHTSTSELTEYIDCLTFQESIGSCTYDKSVRSMHFESFKDNYTYYDTPSYGILINNVFFLPQETSYYSYYNNIFESECSCNTFSNSTLSYNTFKQLFLRNVVTSDNFSANEVGVHSYSNFISTPTFVSNKIQGDLAGNIIGGTGFSSNNLNNAFRGNHICSQFINNTINPNCYSNWFKDVCSFNTIGNNFILNTLNGSLLESMIGNRFMNNKLKNSRVNTFENTVQYVDLSVSSTDIIKNHFQNDINGTGIDFTSQTHLSGDYNCEIFKDSAGNIKLSYIDGAGVLTVVNANS